MFVFLLPQETNLLNQNFLKNIAMTHVSELQTKLADEKKKTLEIQSELDQNLIYKRKQQQAIQKLTNLTSVYKAKYEEVKKYYFLFIF